MTAFRRSGSVASFTWDGTILDPRDQAFADALATRRFRTIDSAASEEVSAGWVTPLDPTGATFTLEDLEGGAGTWLRVRVDKKAMPKAVVAQHIAVAEKARGKRLSSRERRELRDDLMDKLLPRVLPSTSNIDALLFHERGIVLLFATSKGARETFGKLWFESFGVPLQALHALGLARSSVLGSELAVAVEKLEPTRWPQAKGVA